MKENIRSMSGPQLGDRVRVIGRYAVHEGTCKYFGTTLFREGYWVGVELDQPNGKNDGSVEGTRYFSCRPKYGLFARAQVVEVLSQQRYAQQHRVQNMQRVKQRQPAQQPAAKTPALGTQLQVLASIFRFEKTKNEWSEIGDGRVNLFVSLRQRSSSITDVTPLVTLQGTQNKVAMVNHFVEVETKLEPNVGSDRAWVFRAKTLQDDKGEVLALQFQTPKDAMDFSSHFARCCQTVRHYKLKSNMKLTGKEDPPPAPQSNGLTRTKGIPPPPPPPPPEEEAGAVNAASHQHAVSKGNSVVQKQRRRLSIAGSDVKADGVVRRSSTSNPNGNKMDTRKSSNLDGHFEASTNSTVIKSYIGMSKKGYAPYNIKKENQDACFMHEDPRSQSILLGVFDGHGEHGHRVSRYIERNVPAAIFKHPSWATSPKTAITDALLSKERDILQNRSINTSLSGTTAVVAAIRQNVLTVANIGDSRLILALRNDKNRLKPCSVTEDHKPDLPSEQKRIEKCGGRVWAMTYDDGVDGPARVWLKDQELPGLAMSRSIGDEVAKRAGVISDPEIFEYEIPEQAAFLCMATDGLWEFMSDDDVVHFIEKANGNGKLAIETLMKESERRWKNEEPVVDDTTIVIAYF